MNKNTTKGKAAFETSSLIGPKHPEFLKEEVLADIFRATVARAPNATAIISGERRLSYLEVDRLSDRIAAALVRRGAASGKVIGLYFTRGVNLLLSQIAVTKTGATWLPFDSETPKDRMAICLADCGAIGLLVDEDVEDRVVGFAHPVWSMSDAEFNQPLDKALPAPKKPAPGSHAYLIYTSGTTGTPKGIAITHRNICHYLRASNSIFGITAKDVMFQGCSAAFDLSMEEIWVPYLAGAALWVATPEIMADTENLPRRMRDAGVTAIDTVPTLLSMFAEDVDSLRLIIVGGEACPPGLTERFSKKGRRIFNSYGPTETTVVATIAELSRGDTVTIGKPIPNYTAYVVNDNLQLVAAGQQGELLIGGPGVADGYLGRSDLTAQKFFANPFQKKSGDKILYRTGDAVSIDENGNILFHGRVDDQVKIRGFRVELGEIETAVGEDAAIEHAAVVLRKDHGLERMVAFIVPRKDAQPDIHALRETLRRRLPPYMVPAAFEVIAEVPRLISGKVDRKSLKNMTLASAWADESQSEQGNNPVEVALIAAAKQIFPGQPILRDADFFTDLGGHSLLAAQFISKVRLSKYGQTITLQDMYAGRTVENIAKLLIDRGAMDHTEHGAATPMPRASMNKRFWCGVAQTATLPLILCLHAAPWLAIFISYSLISPDENSVFGDAGFVFVGYALVTLFNYIFVPLAKLVIMPKTKPGVYPLWGTYYYRIWLVQRLTGLVHLKWMQGTPVIRFYLRLLGAKVGKDVLISDLFVHAYDLLEIGDHASLGGQLIIANARVVGDKFIIGPVKIGNDVSLGNSVVIEENTVIGDGSELSDLTSLLANTNVPPNERWSGSPPLKVADLKREDLPAPAEASQAQRVFQTILYAVLLVVLPPITVLPVVPTFRVMEWIDSYVNPLLGGIAYNWYLPIIALPAAASMVLFTCLLVVALRWLILPRLKAGSYSIFGSLYLRKWIVTLVTDITLDAVTSIFATIYMPAWYRLMGAKIGAGTEISTSLAGRYDLIDLGKGNFIADEVRLADEELRRNWMTLGSIKTGSKVFIGNSAVVPMNYSIETGALIGVKSRPPDGGAVGAAEIWFGSPAIKLPVRQTFAAMDTATFRPGLGRQISRGIFEAFNISLPTALFITLATYGMELLNEPINEGSWAEAISMGILVVILIDITQLFLAAVLKWSAMGVYRPTIKPMWSWWAMRTEAVAVMFWGMASNAVLEHLRGTPMLPFALRLFGVKIGKGTYMDATDITEFDCVSIGDYAVINVGTVLQTHLYEDRLMKVGRIIIGKDVTVGAGSTVLYDTHVGDGAQIGPLTLVMKGESLPTHSSWVGSPAQPMSKKRNVLMVAPAGAGG